MNREVSAGGIIVSKSGRSWYILLMKDMNGNWTFPKGKLEKGESYEYTAKREIEEEVGITDLTRVAELTPSEYWYYRKGSIKKTVHYFLFTCPERQRPVVQMEEGISEAVWVPFAKAKTMLGYPDTNAALLSEAKANLPT